MRNESNNTNRKTIKPQEKTARGRNKKNTRKQVTVESHLM